MILSRLVDSTMELISRTFETVLGWIDAPIMRERVNKGSDRFFAAERERRETAGDSPLEVVDFDGD